MNYPIDVTDVVLKTKRLVLRPFAEKDLNDFFEYAKVEGVGYMAGWDAHKNIAETKEVLQMFIKGKNTLAIEKDGKVIGSIGIDTYDEENIPMIGVAKSREIGFVLSKDYWGQGIMTEACHAVLEYLFTVVELDCVICGYWEINTGSKRVQEKLGFHQLTEYDRKSRNGEVRRNIVNVMYKEEFENRTLQEK